MIYLRVQLSIEQSVFCVVCLIKLFLHHPATGVMCEIHDRLYFFVASSVIYDVFDLFIIFLSRMNIMCDIFN